MLPSAARRLGLSRLASCSLASTSSSASFHPPCSSSASGSTHSQARHLSSSRSQADEDDVFVQSAKERGELPASRPPPSGYGIAARLPTDSTREGYKFARRLYDSGADELPTRPGFLAPEARRSVHPRSRSKTAHQDLRGGTFGLEAPVDDGALSSLNPYLASSNLPSARSSSSQSFIPLALDLPTLDWFSSFSPTSWHRHLTFLPSSSLRHDHILKARIFRYALRFRLTPSSRALYLSQEKEKLARPEIELIRDMVKREVKHDQVKLKWRRGEKPMRKWEWASLEPEERERVTQRLRGEMIEDAQEGEASEELRRRFGEQDRAKEERERRVEERMRVFQEARERGESWEALKAMKRIAEAGQ